MGAGLGAIRVPVTFGAKVTGTLRAKVTGTWKRAVRKREPGTCFAESQAPFAKVTGTKKIERKAERW